MADKELAERFLREKERMDEALGKLSVLEDNDTAKRFLEMARNYHKDSAYFHSKNDDVRAFEAIVISWAYVDAGINAGLFTVPDSLKSYFTS